MTFATLFSGCECVGVGFAAAGFSPAPLWQCEWDKRPAAVLRYRFPGVPNYGDVASFPAETCELPDVVWMSPPCQDLSIIGKQAGLTGEKSKYFYEATSVIRRFALRGWRGILLMEQVPQILLATSKGPAPMRDILLEFLELRPLDLGWTVFNARYCGVPQSRRRVFLALDFGGERVFEILSDTNPGPLHTEKGRVSWVEDSGTDPHLALATQHPRYTGNPDSLALVARAPERYGRPENIVPCLMTRTGTNSMIRGCWPQVEGSTLRWRTPKEHERLMGLPDDWTRFGINAKGREIEMSDAARYHMTGNGVVAPIAEHIARNILRLSS